MFIFPLQHFTWMSSCNVASMSWNADGMLCNAGEPLGFSHKNCSDANMAVDKNVLSVSLNK